ncbi:MAG: right-handed parallel beta-helix repeat-containing protein [Thermoplasmata archaeon]|nr:right-handed parallel beta-helix repeat-containing protein [Thermoplasmata archaeon]
MDRIVMDPSLKSPSSLLDLHNDRSIYYEETIKHFIRIWMGHKNKIIASGTIIALLLVSMLLIMSYNEFIRDRRPDWCDESISRPVFNGEVHEVDLSGNRDFSTIQEAINNASSGDTIIIGPGTYYENLKLNKTLHLVGNGSSTVIASWNPAPLITILAGVDGCHLENITLNALRTSSQGDTIQVLSDGNLIEGCNITDGYGNGIALWWASFNTIERCVIEKTITGIEIYEGERNQVVNCRISDAFSHGIYVGSNRNLIEENYIIDTKYGIWISSGENNAIADNNYRVIEEYDIFDGGDETYIGERTPSVDHPDKSLMHIRRGSIIFLSVTLPTMILLDVLFIKIKRKILSRHENIDTKTGFGSRINKVFGLMISFQIGGIFLYILSYGYLQFLLVLDIEGAKFLVVCCFLLPLLFFASVFLIFLSFFTMLVIYLDLYKTSIDLKILSKEIRS